MSRTLITVVSAVIFSVALSPFILIPIGYVLTISTGAIMGLMFTQ
jgi:hypothetical protein